MTNLLLPLYSTFYVLGVTLDLINYDDVHHTAVSIFNTTDYEKNQTNILNTAYHVLPGDDLPASAFELPVDAGVRYQFGTMKPSINMPALYIRNPDSVKILVRARYIKEVQSLKAGAPLVPGWQNTAKNHTHYVDKFLMGNDCYGLFKVKSNVTGDVQILQQIITDVMGTSGEVTKDTVNLWKKAEKAFEENPDIRGKVEIGYSVVSTGSFDIPGRLYIERFLEAVPKIPQNPPPSFYPTLVSFRQLHELDSQFPSFNKNSETEKYLIKLDYITNDLISTQELYEKLVDDRSHLPKGAISKLEEFHTKVSTLCEVLKQLASGNYSIYKELTNKDALQRAFNQYESGLLKTTRTYYVALKRLYETIVVSCRNEFLTPTRGSLNVERDEVIIKMYLFGNITVCQNYCEEDKRCRAFGYVDVDSSHATLFSGKGHLCRIFYRSTNTATLIYPKGPTESIQTYDRICDFITY